MKTSEKILLAGTIGLGLVIAAAHLPGKGRGGAAPPGPAMRSAVGKSAAKVPPATLELLATKQVALKPLPPKIRNPFRPVPEEPVQQEIKDPAPVTTARKIGAEKVARLRLTGIFDEAGGLAALVNGKVVRAGDRIGELSVVRVTARGVVLEYRGERFFKELYKRFGEPPEPGQGSSTTEPGETNLANR